jgi:predicted AAA+ superfamily ATPase
MAMKRLIHNDLDAWRKKEFRKPLLLQGARQVGKTYSLLEFGKASFPKVHYVRGR